MTGIRFEMLSIMQTLHAVGLMPDDVYEAERARLVALIEDQNWRANPLDFDKWMDKSGFGLPDARDMIDEQDHRRFKTKDGASFDWRVLIADLLKSALNIDDFNANSGSVIEQEILHLGVSAPTYFGRRTIASHLLSRESTFTGWVRRIDDDCGSLGDLRSEVTQLREEVRHLRSELSRNRKLKPEAAKNLSSNAAEIAELQDELARCHMNAIRLEGAGQHFVAGDWRGKAAALESKLRALGA